MKNRIILLIYISILALSSTAYAGSSSIGLKASTLGAGLEIERSFSDSIGGRIGVNYFTYSYTGTEDDIEYDFDLNLMSVSALLDWHPFQGRFRISGGVVYNNNDLDADAKSSASYDIGDITFTQAEVGTLKSNIDFNDIAPYLGLGWDTSFGKDKGFGFLFELGVMYQGTPKVELSADGTLSSNPVFLSELAKEEDNLQDDIDEYKFYPVVAIGLSYRF